MDVTLLGSGSADGWPNPFCRCASCTSQRAAQLHRVSTSALVDDQVLLDLGPDTLSQATAAQVDLSRLRWVAVTHAHPDHWSPQALLAHIWTATPGREPLTVLGPPPVVDDLERWFGGDDRLASLVLSPGDTVDLGGYQVRALASTHEVPTLLYDVTGPDGARVLYATDTGPLPTSTLAAVEGRAYDLVLLEQTFGSVLDHGTQHHDLVTFPRTLAALRERGAVTPATRCIAVHLSHHNPPEPELAAALAEWRSEPGRDGQRWRVPGHDGKHRRLTGREAPADRPPPPRRTLLLGGVRSGKSALAEQALAAEPSAVYVATGGERRDDDEWQQRVTAHRARRPSGWTTLETTDLVPLLRDDGPALLIDCLTLWLTAQMDDVGAWDQSRWEATGVDALRERVDALVVAWRTTPRRVVAVSNEVGWGVVPETWSGRLFRDEMGRLNARLAAESDRVCLVVAGRETRLR